MSERTDVVKSLSSTYLGNTLFIFLVWRVTSLDTIFLVESCFIYFLSFWLYHFFCLWPQGFLHATFRICSSSLNFDTLTTTCLGIKKNMSFYWISLKCFELPLCEYPCLFPDLGTFQLLWHASYSQCSGESKWCWGCGSYQCASMTVMLMSAV